MNSCQWAKRWKCYYLGGARSKGFVTLRNVSKLPFFDKIGHAKSVGFRFYSAIWRSESRISTIYLEITSISLIYSFSRKKQLVFWISRGLNRLTCVTRQIRGDSKLKDQPITLLRPRVVREREEKGRERKRSGGWKERERDEYSAILTEPKVDRTEAYLFIIWQHKISSRGTKPAIPRSGQDKPAVSRQWKYGIPNIWIFFSFSYFTWMTKFPFPLVAFLMICIPLQKRIQYIHGYSSAWTKLTKVKSIMTNRITEQIPDRVSTQKLNWTGLESTISLSYSRS